MRFAGNVIWFVFGGAVIAMLWLIGAAMFAISIIGLPITRAAIEMAKLSAFPFGKDVVHVRELDAKGLRVRFKTRLTGHLMQFSALPVLTNWSSLRPNCPALKSQGTGGDPKLLENHSS